MNLLLLSSSKVDETGYLAHALPLIKEFLPTSSQKPIQVLFIPYAGVTISYDEYQTRVNEALKPLNIELTSIHQFNSDNNLKDAKKRIQNADCLLVGGGNTFALLKKLYDLDILETIHETVMSGTPYIGWSAGSNIAGATIRTTNDMPIVEPPSFSALNLIPFQINPHYIEMNPKGHNGETRQQRIEEYLVANPDGKVIAIPEGTAICCKDINVIFQEGTQTGALAYLFSSIGKKALTTGTNIIKSVENNSSDY